LYTTHDFFVNFIISEGDKCMMITEIRKMSIIERLQAMEELWDLLCHEEIEIESPEWHKDILESRRKKIAKGEAEFISLEDLKSGNYK